MFPNDVVAPNTGFALDLTELASILVSLVPLLPLVELNRKGVSPNVALGGSGGGEFFLADLLSSSVYVNSASLEFPRSAVLESLSFKSNSSSKNLTRDSNRAMRSSKTSLTSLIIVVLRSSCPISFVRFRLEDSSVSIFLFAGLSPGML